MGLQNIRTTYNEVQKLAEFNSAPAELSCPSGSQPYALVCYRELERVERSLESAEPGMVVMAILLALIMVATIVCLGLYVRHLRHKLSQHTITPESSAMELQQPLNIPANTAAPGNVIDIEGEPTVHIDST